MEAKGFTGHANESSLSEDQILDGRPLFEDFDPTEDGGIGVTEDGRLFEVRNIEWSRDGNTDVLSRTSELPYQLDETGRLYGDPLTDENIEGRGANSLPVPWLMSLGKEIEISTQDQDGNWHRITYDGDQLIDSEGNAVDRPGWLQPEAYRHMVEYDTGIAFGAIDLKANTVAAAAKAERLLEEQGVQSPYGSVHPEDVTKDDVTAEPYVLNTSEKMVSMREFTANSAQLHVQMLSIPAGIHALNNYQRYQALTNLLTASAPVRDGSFEQTIEGHYNKPDARDTEDGFDLPAIPKGSDMEANADKAPWDWRELSRTGSPSAGAFDRAGEPSFSQFLRNADQSLRDGSIISYVREFGWHRDRLRPDKGTVEICNLGTAGGNLHKVTAVDELVSTYIMAEQMRFLNMTPTEQAAEKAAYEQNIEIAAKNNFAVTMEGKDAELQDGDGTPLSPAALLRQMIDVIDTHGPAKLSQESRAELSATLERVEATDYKQFETAEEVFEAALQPLSPYTNNEALRIAHQVEPEVSPNRLMLRYARTRRDYTYEMEALVLEPARNARIGNLALYGQVTNTV